MKTLKVTALMAITVIMTVGVLVSFNQIDIEAEETEEADFKSANDIRIQANFVFREGETQTSGFQTFKQISGFDPFKGNPEFELQGVVGQDKILLYEAADQIYYKDGDQQLTNFGQFDADIHLTKSDVPVRTFTYSKCDIVDYEVLTQFDKEEGWTTSKGFAIVDKFKIQCSGYHPHNPIYEMLNSVNSERTTTSTLDLESNTMWSDHNAFKSTPFQ